MPMGMMSMVMSIAWVCLGGIGLMPYGPPCALWSRWCRCRGSGVARALPCLELFGPPSSRLVDLRRVGLVSLNDQGRVVRLDLMAAAYRYTRVNVCKCMKREGRLVTWVTKQCLEEDGPKSWSCPTLTPGRPTASAEPAFGSAFIAQPVGHSTVE